MDTINLFLASSLDLKNDRDQFEIFVARENDKLTRQGRFISLTRCENFDHSMALGGLQSKYNESIKSADLFVILYSQKVGKYTNEEFDVAVRQYELTGRPRIYTYYRETMVSPESWSKEDINSFHSFQEKLKQLRHFTGRYASESDLERDFKNQLEFLKDDLFPSHTNSDDENSSGPRKKKLHNLPARTYGNRLIGREEDLKKVIEKFLEFPIVTIQGFSGVGKTSLALQIAYTFLNKSSSLSDHGLYFDCIVWLSAKSRDQKTWLNEVLNKIAEVLEHPSIGQIPVDKLQLKKKQVEELLRHDNNRLLLVIDNFETIDDQELEDWLQTLEDPTKVLITSQKQGFSFCNVNLTSLNDRDAVALIRMYAQAKDLNHLISTSDEKIGNLARITGGNPLAIRLAIGQINGGNLTLDQVVTNLKEGNPTTSIDLVFDKIHETSWISIGANAQQLLLAVPLFVGVESVEKRALQTTSALSQDHYVEAVETLLNWKLLEPNFDDVNRVVIHPMTRRFVKAKLSHQPEFESKARKLWCQYYFSFVQNSAARTDPPVPYWNALVHDEMKKIDSEWPTVFEVLKYSGSQISAENDRLLLDLIFLLVHYMDSRFYNLERIKYVKLAIAAANRLGKKYEEALLRIDSLGWTLVEENNYEDAFKEITKGIELAKEVKSPSLRTNELLALGHAWAARVKIEQGSPDLVDEAVGLIERALKFNDGRQPWIRFRVLMASGDIYLKQNNGTRALEKFKQAREKMAEYGGEGHSYQINPRIGLAHIAIGDLTEAEKIFTELSHQNSISIGKLYGDYGLALIRYKRGDQNDANAVLGKVKEELSKRTSSNLLLKLIKEFETT